jgi:1-acyl-sn-glycerol-3-phosphate acyltransferase
MAHLVHGVVTVMLVFPGLSAPQKRERIRLWALALLARLAIQLVVKGKPTTQGPALLVVNHISWLDIVLLLASCNGRFISKSDIQHWPLIGRLAIAADTLFVERKSRRDAMRVVHQMVDSLRGGAILVIFPEATTSDGEQVLPFHANLFQAALSAHAPIVPVALRFFDKASGQLSLAPCYINQDTLLGSIWRTLSAPALCATLTFGAIEQARGRDRRTWAIDARDAVAALLPEHHSVT